MYVSSLIQEQAARGLRVGAFVLSGTRVAHELEKAGIQTYHALRSSHFYPKDISKLRGIIKQEQYDVVHSHTSKDVWPGSLSVLGSRVAHVSSVYVVAMPKRDPHHWFIYRRVDALVSSSTYVNWRLGRELPIANKKIHLVRYGRNLDRLATSDVIRERTRQQLSLSDGQLAFGIIGRIEETKGVHEFAQSLLSLEPSVRERVKYFVVGSRCDENHNACNQWLVDFQQRPEIRDHLEILPWSSDPVPYYNALDALVLASYREMYSLSVLEAMAMSLPVIGTDSEGTTEQIGANKRGLLVEPRSARSIAEAVTKYVADPLLMKIHGDAGNEWVRREHCTNRSMESLEGVYAQAIARRVPAARKVETTGPKVAPIRKNALLLPNS